MINSGEQSKVWNELNSDASDGPRIVRRVASSPTGLWFGESRPKRLKEFGIEAPLSQRDSNFVASLPKMKGIDFYFESQFSDETCALWLRAADPSFNDQFPVIVEDLMNLISDNRSSSVVEMVTARLLYWQKFFSRNIRSLSREDQIGLFGELCLLMELQKRMPKVNVLDHWQGPLGGSQDFSFPNVSIEVKSTTSNQPRVVKISSEFQLQTPQQALFLLLMRLEETTGDAGITLPMLIDQIRELYVDNTISLDLFEELLMDYGYFEILREEYPMQLSLVEMQLFQVTESFPKIVPEDLDLGIEKVTYQLLLNQLKDYMGDVQDLFKMLVESDDQ